jgi:outer membrane lipoprotein SlyB
LVRKLYTFTQGETMTAKNNILAILALFTFVVALPGCAPPSTSGQVYSRDQARISHQVFFGTVLEVRPVTIEGTQSGAGAVAGGLLGGIAGSGIGGGTGRGLATVTGAIVGATAGSAVEKSATTVQGVEVTVELDNGELVAIVQQADVSFLDGDRVRVLRSQDGTMRVRQ